ncbi:MAG: N-formylglutamate deformylase [Sphingobacteriaceae bacterium]|nr:MAG: N-formylglutamate deformylase [Sphingobacteriaceae bacterium]
MNLYRIIKPKIVSLPIVLSVPHAGIGMPEDIEYQIRGDILPPDDTDWLVDELYDFAGELGIPIIIANYSRWVIDLNRNPDNTPLYSDGRIITALCTATDFLRNPIYIDKRLEVDKEELERRRTLYFEPYHYAVQHLLNETKAMFGSTLLWDCHSIRRRVITINPEPFPDLILGDADGTAASSELTRIALGELSDSDYKVAHNTPFKGGYITRHFGKPQQNQHALQLEMAKDLYLDNNETGFDIIRADKMRITLKQTLTTLGQYLLA